MKLFLLTVSSSQIKPYIMTKEKIEEIVNARAIHLKSLVGFGMSIEEAEKFVRGVVVEVLTTE